MGSVGLMLDGLQSRNLFEVGFASPMLLPKVAEYSNLGLKDAIPLGIARLHVQTRRTKEALCGQPRSGCSHQPKVAVLGYLGYAGCFAEP